MPLIYKAPLSQFDILNGNRQTHGGIYLMGSTIQKPKVHRFSLLLAGGLQPLFRLGSRITQ